jgi:hypothetical protein
MISVLAGLKVPAPKCNVTESIFIFCFFSPDITSGVKCNPAVGAATDPLLRAKTV